MRNDPIRASYVSRALPPGLSLQRPRSLAAQVADVIVAAIASGRIEFGQRLVETDLAGSLDVSRIPVREAFKMLHAQGILTAAPHRGVRVVEFGEGKIDSICKARVALERLALSDAVAQFAKHPDRLSVLDELIGEMQREASRQNWIETSKADLEFHRQICRASENEIVITLWEALAPHVMIVFGREIRTERDGPRLIEQHERILNLIRGGKVSLLHEEINRHIMRLRRRRSAEPVLANASRAAASLA
jgi:DNA-binding GntR family transcriptional regulator